MTDATEQLRAALEDRLRFEAVVSDIASRFVNLESHLIGGCIEDAQRRLVEALDVDRSSLFQLSEADGGLVFTHTWSRPGRPAVPLPRGVTVRQFPWALAKTMNGEMVCFSSLDELPADTPDRQAFEDAGVKSNVTVPLIVSGRVIGSIAFSATQEERAWAPEIVGRLRLVAQVFAGALSRTRGQAELRKASDDRVQFEALIADLASQFVNLDSGAIDGAIEDAQRRLVEALGIDRSSLWQASDTERKLVLTHTWSRPGLELLTPAGAGTSSGRFPWMTAKILQGELVCFSSLIALPPEAVDREELERIGTKSNVTVPLVVSGRVIGALTFAAVREERSWPPDVVNRLSLIGQVFAGALARKRTEIDLRRTLDENARLRDRLTQENVYLQREVKERRGISEIIGQSRAIQHLLEQVDKVAPTGATVLLLGETGTGKELIATAIHERSPRKARAMVRVNCAAIPTALIESELFGREKGAYTGALARQAGRFELADGSTIFLDEIGELPGDVQVKLLRVLQEKQVERLGSSRPISIDVRIVAATNLDLERAIADGTFREDLYYRLNVFTIFVPSLRERKADLLLLADHFLDKFSREHSKVIKRISTPAIDMLMAYHWPGNVRELENALERAVLVCDGAVVHGHHLPPSLQTADSSGTVTRVSLKDAVAAYERDLILDALKTTRGNCAKAARLLDTTERILNYKIHSYAIDTRRFKSSDGGRRRPAGPVDPAPDSSTGAISR